MSTSRRYVFTRNNPPAEHPDWQALVDAGELRYISYQLELAPTTGTPHWQGYLELCSPSRMAALHRKPQYGGFSFQVSRGTREQARDYTQKDDSRAPGADSGPWEFGDWGAGGQGTRSDIAAAVSTLTEEGLAAAVSQHPVQYVKYHRGFEALAKKLKPALSDSDFIPRPWQQKVLDWIEANKGDDRKILWITDVAGNIGKSRLCTHLIKEHGAIELGGKVADMQYAYNSHPIVCFDISRTQAENIKHLYSMAEQLKNGRFLSTKYESEMKIFDSPAVIFFANVSFDSTAWTADRCKEMDSTNPDFNR